MEASQPGGRERPPLLQSWAACFGIAVLVGLSIYVGARFWWSRDQALSALTIGAELVAFAGLGVVAWQWKRSRLLALGAAGVTLIAAAWCAFTMFQNIAAETREEAITRAKERPAYIFADNAASTARNLLQSRLEHPNPRPACSCPQTIASWEAAEAAAIDRLRSERDNAVRQMEAAIPDPEMDWLALARGVGVEIAKLFGFAVFALSETAPRRRRREAVEMVETPTTGQPRQPFQVVEGGLSTDPPTAQPLRQPARSTWWSSLKTLGKTAVGAGVAAHAQPLPQPVSTIPTTPVAPPVESVVERPIAPVPISELPALARKMIDDMGERRVASKLSARYGEHITRHQVRIWVGREPAPARAA